MKAWLYTTALVLSSTFLLSQGNLVPNGGFEEYLDTPEKWYFNGEDFSEIVRYWISPTPASPDAYGPKIKVPKMWKAKGFGDLKAFQGQRKIGMTIYGCDKGKPHCREYIQIRLSEPMVLNQKYKFKMQIGHLDHSLLVNNLGILFSTDEVSSEMDKRIEREASHKADKIVRTNGHWKEWSFDFVADQEYEFLTIGNFNSDQETSFEKEHDSKYNYAYYYIDNVSLTKRQPLLPVPSRTGSLSDVSLEEGKLVVLDNIYFDHDRTDFLSRSFEQLDKLYMILKENPSVEIEVHGHTDDLGKRSYNHELSIQRSKAVVQFLLDNGIAPYRLSYRGFGSKQPIDTNDTIAGRKRNRRVEFLILKN